MDRYRSAMPKVKIFMGVGATIDYEADAVVRAPRWMTRNGLEWLYRITTEPKRYWRRYLRDMEFFWLVLLDGLGLYRAAAPFGKDRRMIRTAMVGLGKMGLSHLAIVRAHPDIDLVAGCDATAYLTDILSKHAGLKCYADFDRMLDARAARRAGRRDAVEAACADGREGARARPARVLREALRARRRRRRAAGRAGAKPSRCVTQVGYHYRFVGAFKEAARLVKSGALGDDPPRSRRSLRAGRAAPQGRHLALGEERGRRRALRLRLPRDRPRQLHRRARRRR